MRRFCAGSFTVALALILAARFSLVAVAQTPPATPQAATVTGTVLDDQLRPVAGAQVRLSGPATTTTSTGADGTFAFRNLGPGVFRVEISKAGFTSATQDDIALVAGSVAQLRFTLQAASFSSLRTIGNVSVAARGRNAINTTSAAIADVAGSTFVQQGQLAVTRVLNQLPGITISPSTGFGTNTTFLSNASSPLATGVPQIRGALPYETASLIDGHPISIGVAGIFSPIFINPYVLQDVEVVKGPGASPTNVNYAIGGTVNYRTLEPTRERHESVDVGIDQFGGQTANFRVTGTLPGDRWSYAFDYATQGTQGYARGFNPAFGPVAFNGPTSINGTPTCKNPAIVFCGFTFAPGNPQFLSSQSLGAQYILCCPQLPMNFYERNELGKIRYAFSPSTALTFTYLGAQSRGSEVGGFLYTLPGTTFTPPPGYTGSYRPGAAIPFNLASSIGSLAESNDNLFQTEFRTAIGKTVTLLARQYAAGVQSFAGGPGNAGPTPGTFETGGTFYGGVPLGGDTNPTIFNGTPGTLTSFDAYLAERNRDRLNGYTVEVDKQAGEDLLSLSYDRVKTNSFAASESPIAFLSAVGVPDGTAQTFQTVMLRGQVALSPQVRATLSNYVTSYTDRYSQDGGKTFLNSTHAYDAPRLSLTWRPNSGISVRSSAGFSIAPPYANLLSNSLAVLPSNIQPPTYYTTTANSGDVRPETAFGFDLGFDTRLPSYNILSFDAYQTTLHDQFLQTTSVNGTYTPPPGLGLPVVPKPLFVTRTENLGHSRYEGLELSLRRAPPRGAGYTLSGSLIRGYPYDLPPGFYDTGAGKNTANLAVLPNVNFQATGLSYNGLSTSRVPYSMGYGEYNYRWRNGAYLLAGVTYYGPNNAFNEPAFGVVNASFNQPLSQQASLQLSFDNITNAYGNYYYNFLGTAVPTPLKNGLLGYTPANVIGPSTARLILHLQL